MRMLVKENGNTSASKCLVLSPAKDEIDEPLHKVY